MSFSPSLPTARRRHHQTYAGAFARFQNAFGRAMLMPPTLIPRRFLPSPFGIR